MKLARRYEKWFNRNISLLNVEYWHWGEYFGLPKLIEGATHFNPLFVYRRGKGTDIYYDMNNIETYNDPLIYYCLINPKKFKKVVEGYEKDCRKLIEISNKNNPKDFERVFNLLLSFWPKFDVINVLGMSYELYPAGRIFQKALKMREKWEKAEYISANYLLESVKKFFPEIKDYSHFLKFDEVKNGKIPSLKELEKRKNGYIYFEGKFMTGIEIEELEKFADIKVIQQSEEAQKEHIRGAIAFKGKVKGVVRTIFELKDLKKIKRGDVLITPMTTPDYAFAMKKAAAFVTDEGGITCHAAIVAREIKKPCIIGTKLATTLFKDGDIVDVNADEGVVRLLKRA